ncbi:quaternary amine ABC transporter ATP-binding protein [Oceanomicrobium pacificus]|uniref:Quaternary amine transport ATP-binding protein n=1 Tax=Oceanomicrobium pacificus TaxID=2692916 RepID=A0A6B0U265_9RHOB|nr:glycine betaine/L-proline ABC transporter ATP-binding protein [Oceanomicrobium pacificus]MXU65121.1 betaine/proline/choline family ABC transporter ATP-binding protein [Oceanomicrobium pacificus]
MAEPKLRIRELYKIFGDTPQKVLPLVKDGMSKAELLDKHGHVLGLRDINIDIPERRIQVIMGLSGSGKSTLIRHINRLIEPTAGDILINGQNVTQMDAGELRDLRRFTASMVFQHFGLLPHRTVQQNVEYGLTIQGIEGADAANRAGHWIERVGLAGYEDRYPGQLSGGMQQRVGLARALATDAEILLMDEAFSALDPLIRTEMQNILLDLQEELHKTIVFITHDLDEALRLGDQIAILRDGEVIQKGEVQDIVLRPADSYIADFTKDINRARVLKVAAIMEPGRKLTSGAAIPASMTIEQALTTLAAAPDGVCAVVGPEGETLGTVSLQGALAAVAPAPPADAEAAESQRYSA